MLNEVPGDRDATGQGRAHGPEPGNQRLGESGSVCVPCSAYGKNVTHPSIDGSTAGIGAQEPGVWKGRPNPSVPSSGPYESGVVLRGVTEHRRNGLGPAAERPTGASSPVSRTVGARDSENGLTVRFAVDADGCGAVGCSVKQPVYEVENDSGAARVLCLGHAEGWLNR